MSGGIVALDLFAGTGWGVALKARGIREAGVEIMPEAVASREAAGMETIYRDVWDGLLGDDPVRFWHALQIASPPCQSFSLAGKGAGRAALDDVLRAIDTHAYRQPERLRSLGADTDERTALVLTPLAHVHRDRPLFIAWEQVPPVLPVWEACAEVLRGMGYSVWVGIIRAEQYGVPQARRRAVLIARADGVAAAPPTPTHSRFYERDPERLDPGVDRWVTMAEALGWGLTSRPSPTITGGGTETGGAEPIAKLARYTSRPDWCFRRPSTTVVADPRLGGPGRSEFVKGGVSRQNRPGSLRLEPHEAAALQSYPVYGYAAGYASVRTAGTRPRSVDEPSATITGRATFAWECADGSRRAASPAELALLQAYPDGFHFAGNKGKQFLQIGNAVPPLMAGAVIDELLDPAALRRVEVAA